MTATLPPQLTITPRGAFDVTLQPPGSKSLTNRALLLAALAEGTSELAGVLFSDDSRVMLDALRRLGFRLQIDEPDRRVVVQGEAGRIPADRADLFLGNAGTAFRFLTAACCLGQGEYRLDGVPRMRQRPIGQLVDALTELGADIAYESEAGFPPLIVRGSGLTGGNLRIPAVVSSQFVSALAQVGPYCGSGLSLRADQPLVSWPYIDMTLHLMTCFGASVPPYKAGARTEIEVDRGQYRGIEYAIEPDASNASYFLAAAAIVPGSRCRIDGIGFRSIQGDTQFASQCLQQMGCEFQGGDDWIEIKGPQRLQGIDETLTDMPDMAQTLATIAVFAEGRTTIRGIGNLRVKETDRMEALRIELTKLGARVTIDGDDLTIDPPPGNRVKHAAIDTYDDHRMAMSFAILGLHPGSPGITINDPRCVEKTFPDFFEYLDRLRP